MSLPSAVQADADAQHKAETALDEVGDPGKSVVMISVHCPGKDTPELGTGVLISPRGHILTAAHVGGNCSGVTTAKVGAIKSPYAAPGEEMTAKLLFRRVNGNDVAAGGNAFDGMTEDLALWKITNLAGAGLVPAKLGTSYPVPGEDVRIIGFAGLPFQYYGNPHNSLPGLTIFKTSLSSVAARTGDIPYRLHYTGATLPGVSGGPVFNARDELVGIHSGRVTAVISDLITTSCTVDSFKNCVTLTYPSPNGTQVQQQVGINFMAIKSALDNYSWATSIQAVPAAWFAAP